MREPQPRRLSRVALFVRTARWATVMATWWPFIEPDRRAGSLRGLWRLARLYERTRS